MVQLGTLLMMQLPELEDELDDELLELELEELEELDELELLAELDEPVELLEPPPHPATVSAPSALKA